jgi:phenylpropionate dioxygenase-like ring-hydroxylating dioxygenase large terminal subunit
LSFEREHPFPLPSGWFAVSYSDELANGQVVPLRAFGCELVLFRTESGRAALFDAHCPHLGAHLGHGGCVVGETLRCPFHAWRWHADGSCAEVPYAKRSPPAARARSWRVVERNGFVLAWHGARDREPWFEVEELPEATSPEWSTPVRHVWTIRSRNQELAENGVDSAHFRFVHGTLDVPVTQAMHEGPVRRNLSPVRLKTPRGEVEGAIESRTFGLGMAVTRFSGICETLELSSTTPIDATTVLHRKSFRQRRVDGKDPVGGVGAALIRDIVKQLGEDVPIWEHKRFLERPVLCDGDGPIADFRRWCQQFY